MTTATEEAIQYAGPAAAEVLKAREKHCFPLMSYFKEPILIARGKMQYVWDDKGNKYLDAFAGVVTVSVGHCHPVVVERAQKQLEKLWHTTTLFLYPELPRYAEKMLKRAKTVNPDLDAVFFTNSGTEATELMATLAKLHTGQSDFIGLQHSFHGRTLMSMSLTGQGPWRHSQPYASGVYHAPANYTYRRPEGISPEQWADICADQLQGVIDHSTSGRIAAFIGEPVSGNGGVIVPEANYWPKVYAAVKKAGGLFVSDEVQCGMGRFGPDAFYGIKKWGVRPDIVDMAKGIGNGYPLGAVVTTRAIADSLKGRLHFNTYGNNPVACTVGEAVLDVIEAEKLDENAAKVGGVMKTKLEGLMKKYEQVGDVRGFGLMLGVELVKDKKSKAVNPELTGALMEGCKKRGVIIGKGGQWGNVLRIKPPLCITETDADTVVGALDESLKEAV
ncbi:MAG: hypothetical protein AUJ52_11115 [Elusimicrobia bacterium CG1_02_63_36]|nr:MAG: hypothetical protein AUJ52_11115 [Elusimicrobia bacterium CG1_02_63_36]PIP82319.1 MAG: aspartate aminotransferase family protein [Elusimicrobia bacterium CG22_combo_CG10-13_8_21_14_all_63_91]PJA17942.1 MAG: aspartate aminotransferase family protein [Elusimicrobia bacterium CG_4_10_14_0_2_um_filter_63_34]PJB24187.1 MAG: aspartate aminotransferase family protein [Elusimicrobia bacterium CG_4_9_14_3_um_filter_62_55]